MHRRIMIVDDDPDILISLRVFLEHQGYEVLTVDSGEDCIQELKRGFKGIVLMDLIMPFMDGLDTLNEIVKKGLYKDNIFSIITANGDPDTDKIRGLGPYIHNFITKPFDLEQLIMDLDNIN